MVATGQKQDPRMKQLITHLESCQLVVTATGERRHIGAFIDPSDAEMIQLADGADSLLPPPQYSNSPLVLKTMRKTGLLTLGDPKIFKTKAIEVEQIGDIDAGVRLVSFLLAAFRASKLKWSSADFAAVSMVRFVPCFDATELETSHDLNSLSQCGDQGSDQAVIACDRLISFQEGCLSSEAPCGFTQLPIFHPTMNSAPSAALNILRVQSPLPIHVMLAHLTALAARASSALQRGRSISEVQAGLLFALQKVESHLKGHKQTRNEVVQGLSDIPFVLFDDGSLLRASAICVGMYPPKLRPFVCFLCCLSHPLASLYHNSSLRSNLVSLCITGYCFCLSLSTQHTHLRSLAHVLSLLSLSTQHLRSLQMHSHCYLSLPSTHICAL